MTAWFPKIIFLAFLVLLLVVHSQARFFLEPTTYEIDGEIVEFYKHWHAKKVEDIDDVINEEVKSTYIGDLHEKLMLVGFTGQEYGLVLARDYRVSGVDME
ncbi:BnaA01g06200D [Brassica napus]|uniref:BnaA01g06200D protein n=2 Tax=Brassica TaxID=3705 RepID=A0A078GSP6_BRANA|nr:BnaA01g06200D [Brassica napus]